MLRWRSNAYAGEGASATPGDNSTAPNSGSAAGSSSLHSIEPHPSSGETTRLDAEYGKDRPVGEDSETDDRERRRRSRLELSPVSRTALTIRTMAGAASVRPKSEGGTSNSAGGDPSPPEPPWTLTSVSSAGEGEGGEASTAEEDTTPDDGEAEMIEGILADPIHHHSFAPDSSLLRPLWGTVRRCTGCGDRLRTLFGGGSSSGGGGDSASSGTDGQTVRCAACGILAHRKCAFSSSRSRSGGSKAKVEMPPCEVNAPVVMALERRRGAGRGGSEKDEVTNANGSPKEKNTSVTDPVSSVLATDGEADEVGGAEVTIDSAKASWDFQSMSKILQENIAAYFSKRNTDECNTSGGCDAVTGNDQEDGDGGEVVWRGEANVADRADAVKRDAIERRLSNSDDSDDDAEKVRKRGKHAEGEENVSALLDVAPSERPPTPPKPRGAVGSALDLVCTAKRTDSNVRIASVAGSIAGGVAGLALAGPAGAMVGAKLFQTAGVLGVLIDGTMSVGVVVAGATVGRNVAQSVSSGERVLTIGGGRRGKDEESGSGRLVLVRPNVVVDPAWEELAAEAKRSAPAHARGGGFNLGASFVANHRRKVAEMAQKDRLRKDADIVGANEYEIPTEDKVVLLVSSSLNDKHSLPGHVYRHLVAEYRTRSQRRKDEDAKNPRDKKGDRIREPLLALAGDTDAADRPGGENCPSRAGRRDAHGVIKHVTATLLEVRPGFASSPRLAERTAAAVEALVFGELYADVFGEITEECRDVDEKLLKKIGTFEAEAQRQTNRRRRDCAAAAIVSAGSSQDECDGPFDEAGADANDDCNVAPSSVRGEDISVGALEALLRLPEATAPADKLALCVEFLECVSHHFSSPPKSGGKVAAAGADNLLKMVCEHVLVAKVPQLNAELTFLEEFARDEQLLRGREGYALVTLQAALHYLNASDDLDRDIFRHCG